MADTRKEAFSTYLTKRATTTNLEEQQRLYAEFIERDNRLYLEELKERFLKGPDNDRHKELERDGSLALFEAIAFCGRTNIVIPTWAATAFNDGFHRVLWAEVATWDEAFDRPWPPRTDRSAVRRHTRIMTEIYLRVRTLHEGGDRAIDEELFEDVGKEFKIGRSLCSKLYYQERRRLGGLPYAIRLPQEL